MKRFLKSKHTRDAGWALFWFLLTAPIVVALVWGILT